jgi:hypothetical protein
MSARRNSILVGVAPRYTYLGSNPDDDSSLWHDATHTLDPIRTVIAPCGATLHILYHSKLTCDSSQWRDATHNLDPTRTVTSP